MIHSLLWITSLYLMTSACTKTEPVSGQNEDRTLSSEEEFEAITPIWSPEEALSELDTLLTFGIPNPQPIFDMYIELYDEGATPACPGTNYNFDGAEVDNAGCYTEDDYFYAGLGELRLEALRQDLHCDCRIVAPDGRMIRGAGNISIFGENDHTTLDVRGSFLIKHLERQGYWLEELPSVNLSIQISNQGTYLEGGYTIQGRSLYTDGFTFSDCSERKDTIHFRDPSGGWWFWTASNSCTTGILGFQQTVIGRVEWDSQQFDQQLVAIVEGVE